jgi:hypothetical protein
MGTCTAYSKLRIMSSANEIEDAVLRLTPDELEAFSTWFTEFEAAAWDRQMGDDVAAGRLDALADEALESSAGRPLHRWVRRRASPRFWACDRQLPDDIRRLADESYQLLRRDARRPSLHSKRLGCFRPARVGWHYGAVAVEAGNVIVWFWIGTTPYTTGSSAVNERLICRC